MARQIAKIEKIEKGGLRLYVPKEVADQLKRLKHRDYVVIEVTGDASFSVKKAKIVVED